MRTFWIALALALIGGAVLSDQLVKVYVNGVEKNMTPAARERDGVTYAPLRAAAEAVGAHVKWQEKTQKAIVCTDKQCADIAASDGIMVNGRLLVPLRLMAQALGAQVMWDAGIRAVRINTRK